MVNIYNFLDYREYLKKTLDKKKQEASFYSLRSISLKIGIKSSGYLSMIINGKRNLSDKLANNLSVVLKLNHNEQQYFNALIKFNQAQNQEDRIKHYMLLKKSAKTTVAIVKKDQYVFYEKWYYAAIREFVAIYTVTDRNVNEMAKKLRPKISIKLFKEALLTLKSVGIIYMDSNGVYNRKEKLITNGNVAHASIVKKFQTDTINLAVNAMDEFKNNEKEFSTISMSINKSAYKLIKDRAAIFRKDIFEILRKTKDAKQVYQLNMQIFPLSVENIAD